MNMRKLKLTGLIMAVGLMAMVAAAACGGGDPEELDLEIRIMEGVMSPATIEVKQGDMVTLNIDADEGGAFHLHTYGIEMDIEGGQETDFFFVAKATGRFKITYHPAGEHDEGGHGGIFESEELAPGASFSYEIDEHLAGETVLFHSHLRPALNGSIVVSQDSSRTGAAAIEYSDEGAEPHEVIVDPGTVITWTNNSSTPQTVISGLHSDMKMKMEEEEEHDEENKEGEIEIGFLEVQPR